MELTVEGDAGRYDDIEFTDKTKNAKVLIATPNYTNLFSSEAHVSHMECNAAWSRWGIKTSWSIVGRTFVHFARTLLCQAGIDGGFTHIFWLDDDATIDAELLPRYLEHDKDVVITPYYMRRAPHQIGILTSTTGDFHDHSSYRNLDLTDMNQGLIQVDGGGTHAMLIKVDCLTRKGNDSPYRSPYPPELLKVLGKMDAEDVEVIDHFVGDMVDEKLSMAEENDMGKPYFIMPKVGTEDMLWCYRAKKKGIELWCDTDVDAGHIGFTPIIMRQHRQAYEDLNVETPEEVQAQDVAAEVRGVRKHSINTERVANLI